MIVSLQIDKHALDYACFVLCKSTKTFQYSAHYHQIICLSSIKVVYL